MGAHHSCSNRCISENHLDQRVGGFHLRTEEGDPLKRDREDINGFHFLGHANSQPAIDFDFHRETHICSTVFLY